MFFRSSSLRTRLTVSLTAIVSVALGLVFLVIAALLQQQALNRRYAELRIQAINLDREVISADTIKEAQEDAPGGDFVVYQGGKILFSTLKNTPNETQGENKQGDMLSYGLRSQGRTIMAIGSWSETEHGLNQLRLTLLGLWLPMSLLTAFAAWRGCGFVLRPVEELVNSAEELSRSPNDRLLQPSTASEFQVLTSKLNNLITQIRSAAALKEQFATDAAHELRTPLALMRTRIETNIRQKRTADEHVDNQQALLGNIERLTGVVEILLETVRSAEVRKAPIQLDVAVRDAVAEWTKQCGFPVERINLILRPCTCLLRSDEVFIILRNVLENSSKHGPVQASINISLNRFGESAILIIQDGGNPLPESDRCHLFDRFFQGTESEASKMGHGVGLSVVRRIVGAAGGSAEFAEDGIRITLPLAEG